MASSTAPRIPLEELSVTASRSSGPGGQHVNKSSTRVTVTFNVLDSNVLSPEQRELLLGRLGYRISNEGNLRTASQVYRSQARNRAEAIERMQALVDSAFVERPSRTRTRPTRPSVRKRLETKARRGRVKKLRKSPPPEAAEK